MTEQELDELIAAGHELPGVEFKPAGQRTDPYLFAVVTRAVLGMANRADGGVVIVGVEEAADKTLRVSGLGPQDLPSWNYDDVAAGLAAAAEPFVTLELEPSPYHGVTLLVIRVHEFETVPVICKKQYLDGQGRQVLRQGALYVRPRRKPETSEIPSQTEMRELLDLAITKGLRRFLERASAAGLSLPIATTPSDDEKFDDELGDLR